MNNQSDHFYPGSLLLSELNIQDRTQLASHLTAEAICSLLVSSQLTLTEFYEFMLFIVCTVIEAFMQRPIISNKPLSIAYNTGNFKS